MIKPFVPEQVSHDGARKVVSYGLSSAGYDIRLSAEVFVFTPVYCHSPVDPKNFDSRFLTQVSPAFDGSVVIPPHSYVLGRSVETFDIPRDVVFDCVGKSTFARSGIHVNLTPGEPCWKGQLTIELSNASPCPVKVYANEGIAQLRFFRIGEVRTSYADRGGKYMDQVGVVPPRMK